MDPPPDPPFVAPVIVMTNPNKPTPSTTAQKSQIYITKDPITHRPVMVRKRVGKLSHVRLTGYLAANLGVGRERSAKTQPTPQVPTPAPTQFAILAPPSFPQFELINQAGLITYKPVESSPRLEEVKEEKKEEPKEEEKPSEEEKKDKEDAPKGEEASAPEATEAPPTGQDPAVKPMQQHVCAGCGKIRSASYHYRLQQSAGADPPPNFCRKCINEITSNEEEEDDDDDDDYAIEGRRFLERRQRNQLRLLQESLNKQDVGSTASSEETLRRERRNQRHDSSNRRRGPGRRIQVWISDGEDDDKDTGVMILRGQGEELARRNAYHSDVKRFHSESPRKRSTRSRSSSTEYRASSRRTSGRVHIREHERRRARRPSVDDYTDDAERRLAAHPLPYRHGYFQPVDQPVIGGRSGRLPFIRKRSYSMHENGMSYEQKNPEYHHRYHDTRQHAEYNEEEYLGDRRPPTPPLRRARISGNPGRNLRAEPRDEEDRYWDSDVAEVGERQDRVRFQQGRDYPRHEGTRWISPPLHSPERRRRRTISRGRYYNDDSNFRGKNPSDEDTYYFPSDDNSSNRTERRYNRPARAPSPPTAIAPPPAAALSTRPRYLARHAHVDDEDDEEISRAMRETRLQGRGKRGDGRRERERSRSPSLLTSAWGSGRRGSRGVRW